ncbi:mucin-7-like [Chiroxiphia lanceolata]|uniref:mucin-7-like n=1 Tax=Chiroxiphia lanceolata TaxID=296741 RepID=UPI0013CE5E3F|nr:mucin-7-like [Chiroxiphia lanceolata]
MALSALWQRCVSWSSAIAQFLQPFVSPGTSCPTGSANLGQQPGQKQQPLPAPSAPAAGTRTQLPPPVPLASSHGIAPPSGNARRGARLRRKPLAPVPPVRDTQHGPTGSANPQGHPWAVAALQTPASPWIWTPAQVLTSGWALMSPWMTTARQAATSRWPATSPWTRTARQAVTSPWPATSPWTRTARQAVTSRWPATSPWMVAPPQAVITL